MIEQHNEQGYCLLGNKFPETLLRRWQDLTREKEQVALYEYKKGHLKHGVGIIEDKVGPRLMRYEDFFTVDPELVNQTIGCPAILELAKKLSGRGSVPIQIDVLFKQQHPHPVINWHQGGQHNRNYPYLNIGIYLDDALAGDGCLSYVPKTQHNLCEIEQLAANHGWEVPGVIEQPAKAGDILVHDMMILHGSQPKRSEGVRRTIYIEIVPHQSFLESNFHSELWIELRKKWMALALEHDEKEIWPEEWSSDYPKVGNNEELFKNILKNREPPIPSVWGTNPVEREDYPIPKDMKNW